MGSHNSHPVALTGLTDVTRMDTPEFIAHSLCFP